ncbi:MAG: putative lipid II flippase FtsW [Actinobacteria bacterium]|nr:putative lipid II flippase FtsW [Actinomycetota bacterium]
MATRVLPRPHLRLVRPEEASPAFAGSRTGERARALGAAWLLVACTVLLTAFGVVMVLSASSVWALQQFGSSYEFFTRQAIYAVVGLVAMVVTAAIPYRMWRRASVPMLAVSVVLLAVVLEVGTTVGGSTRWIVLGPVTLQPSELAKISLVLFTAAVLAKKWSKLDEPAHVALPLLPILGLLSALVMLEPDLGTTVIMCAIVFLLFYLAGVRLRYLLAGGLFCGGLGLVLIVTEGYRASRLLSFLNPWADPYRDGYQVIQSLLALGSGGWFGVGLGASRAKWLYVPNAHTDFIYSIIGEELGMIGAIAVLVLFGALLVAGVRIAARTEDVYGRLLAGGIVGWLGLQAVMNLATVTGLLPVTGVPLPLVSFGGSSLIANLAAIGILLNVARASRGSGQAAAGAAGPRRTRGRRP